MNLLQCTSSQLTCRMLQLPNLQLSTPYTKVCGHLTVGVWTDSPRWTCNQGRSPTAQALSKTESKTNATHGGESNVHSAVHTQLTVKVQLCGQLSDPSSDEHVDNVSADGGCH